MTTSKKEKTPAKTVKAAQGKTVKAAGPAPAKKTAATELKRAEVKTKSSVKLTPAKNRPTVRTAPRETEREKTTHKMTFEKKGASGSAQPREKMVIGRLHDLRKMLVAKRDGILKESKTEISKYISGENRQLVDTANDEGDWAQVDISEELSLKRLVTHRQLLLDIDECLRKIQEGTYGICEECGEEISSKRLSVLPTATHCVDCQESREKFEAFEKEAEV